MLVVVIARLWSEMDQDVCGCFFLQFHAIGAIALKILLVVILMVIVSLSQFVWV